MAGRDGSHHAAVACCGPIFFRLARMTTVICADLVGSTSIFERLGEETASRFVTQLIDVLSIIFEQHGGHVVKLLANGLLVVFPEEGDALAACISIQTRLRDRPVHPGGSGEPVQMQMGIESGAVVEADGDCIGDTVNSAAHLADLAGAAQILTTQNVWLSLLPSQKAALRNLGPMILRGRAEASHVYRVEWQTARNEDAILAGPSIVAEGRREFLELVSGEQIVRVDTTSRQLVIGRATDAAMTLNDPRVSRKHATLEWRDGQFVLTDVSSSGTWIYLSNQSEAVVLRRTECFLAGRGLIVPGCERSDDKAPLVAFSVSV